MNLSGISQENIIQIGSFNLSGGNLELLPDQLAPNNIGLSIDNLIDVVVYATDIGNNQLFGVTFTVTDSTSINTSVTGDYIPLSVGESDTFNVSASLSGYITNQIGVSFTEGEPQRLVIILQEIPKINFICTTLFKNKDGVTISKPITSGYVEVSFEGNADYDINNYLVTFEAFPVGGSKYNSILLNGDVIDTLPNKVTFKVDVVQEEGEFCYVSNISKKLC